MVGAAGDPRPCSIPCQPGSVPGLTPAMPSTALPGLPLALGMTEGLLKLGFPISRALPWGNPGSRSIRELGGGSTPSSTPMESMGVPEPPWVQKTAWEGMSPSRWEVLAESRGHTWETDALTGSGGNAKAAVDPPNRPHGLSPVPHTPLPSRGCRSHLPSPPATMSEP